MQFKTIKVQPREFSGRASAALAAPHFANRSAGVLLHVTSLSTPFGVGDFGPASREWVDRLANASQTWWQMLPLGPPAAGNSPYGCFSAFAGNPLLISPDDLFADGLLTRDEVSASPGMIVRRGRPDQVDFKIASTLKDHLIRIAWDRFSGPGTADDLRDEFDRFRDEQRDWLDDYSLFMALRDAHNGVAWLGFPRRLLLRDGAALRNVRADLAASIERRQFEQFIFSRQLKRLRLYAASRGVKLLGDLPIYVSCNSADVWANPHLFQLNRRRHPIAVAGVPPDLYCSDGQRWGNPLYDWDAMQQDGFAWWVRRLRATLEQVDAVRIDHFRGFAGYWRIPAHSPTAITGRWVAAPGDELFTTFSRELGPLPLIAEDLGLITPDVLALRDRFGLPGMKVLQFAFGGDDNPDLPHNHVANSVVYTGTHDNDTTSGWYRSLAAAVRSRVRAYTPSVTDDSAFALTRLAWSSVARTAIVPLQDVLSLPGAARMNHPGRSTGNWRWQLTPNAKLDPGLQRLAELTMTYKRMPTGISSISPARTSTGLAGTSPDPSATST